MIADVRGIKKRAGRAYGPVMTLATMAGLTTLLCTAACSGARTETSDLAAHDRATSSPAVNSTTLSTPTGTPTASSPSATPKVSASVDPEVLKKIKEARSKMAKDGIDVQRALEPKPSAKVAAVEQSQTGSIKEGGVVRVVSAKGDLSGQRELAYVAGGITKYKGADCSQTFKFATSPKAERKQNLLMCWRTSPTKSVAAIVVDYKGRPSKEKALTALLQKWNSMH